MTFKVSAGRYKSDPEKAVLPTIIYCSDTHNSRTGHVLAFGWWDFAIRFFFMREKK